jgi:hypothetical protein
VAQEGARTHMIIPRWALQNPGFDNSFPFCLFSLLSFQLCQSHSLPVLQGCAQPRVIVPSRARPPSVQLHKPWLQQPFCLFSLIPFQLCQNRSLPVSQERAQPRIIIPSRAHPPVQFALPHDVPIETVPAKARYSYRVYRFGV